MISGIHNFNFFLHHSNVPSCSHSSQWCDKHEGHVFSLGQQVPSPDTQWNPWEGFQDLSTHSLASQSFSYNWPGRKIKTQVLD